MKSVTTLSGAPPALALLLLLLPASGADSTTNESITPGRGNNQCATSASENSGCSSNLRRI